METSSIIVGLIFYVIIPAVVLIILFTDFKKGKDFRSSEDGKKIIDHVISNNYLSEKQFLTLFPECKIRFRKVATYVLRDRRLKGQFTFQSYNDAIEKINPLTNSKNKTPSNLHQDGIEKTQRLINCINDNYNEFIKNESIKVILTNLQKENAISLIDMELSSVYFDASFNAFNPSFVNGNEYAKFLNSFFFKNHLSFSAASIEHYKRLCNNNEKIKRLRETYQLLINQKVINVPLELLDTAFTAFCFANYKNTLNNCMDIFQKISKSLKIDFDNNFDEAIERIYRSDTEDSSYTLYSLHYCDVNDCTLISCYEECKKRAQQVIKSVQEKDRLNSLLNGTNTRRYVINDIDKMEGDEFELVVKNIFERKGYKCEITKTSGDQGIDVVAVRGTERIGIQCKRYSDKVGNHAVMEAVAGAKFYNCNKVLVITNNYFTESAKQLALANKVILWSREELTKNL